MSMKSILFIGLLAVIAIYFLLPNTFNDGREYLTTKISIPKINTQAIINETQETFSRGDEIISRAITGTNLCGKENYGLPDYEESWMQGDGCNELIGSDADLTCLANPPTNYDGTINVANHESDPTISCCQEDGTCQW